MKYLGQKTKYNFSKPDKKLLERFAYSCIDDKTELESVTGQLIPFVQPRDEFTSLCPVTGQPDYAKMEIIYMPNKWCVESKSLKLYLMSYRNHGAFHETVVKEIAQDLFNLLDPWFLRVIGNFASRGGLAIKPIIEKWNGDIINKEEYTKRIRFSVTCWDLRQDLH